MARPNIRRPGPTSGSTYRPPAPATQSADAKADRHRWYNRAAWKRARAARLRSHPLCARCLGRGAAVPAEHVHHVVDLAVAPALGFDAANLECLCHSCHSRETRRRQNASGADGKAPGA